LLHIGSDHQYRPQTEFHTTVYAVKHTLALTRNLEADLPQSATLHAQQLKLGTHGPSSLAMFAGACPHYP